MNRLVLLSINYFRLDFVMFYSVSIKVVGCIRLLDELDFFSFKMNFLSFCDILSNLLFFFVNFFGGKILVFLLEF